MKRALVAIGVNQAGELPRLRDAAASAVKMSDWAVNQGIDCELITDAGGGRVTPGRIGAAVGKFTSAGVYQQLIIYFAGHGVNIHSNEYWLLSDAVDDGDAAVNVEENVRRARYCGISHVVLISDACRTAAEGLQAQGIRGSLIFSNRPPAGTEQPVDQFFACTLGMPAYEVRDAHDAAARYSAVYTHVLVRALYGKNDAAVEWGDEPEPAGFVRPRRLKAALAEAVSKELAGKGVNVTVFQMPDGRIESDEHAWLSKLPVPPELMYVRWRGTGGDDDVRVAPASVPPATLGTICAALAGAAMGGRRRLGQALDDLRRSGPPEIGNMLDEMQWLLTPFGPVALATGCGFKVRGARIAAAHGAGIRTILTAAGTVLAECVRDATAVLLVFEDGRGALLPALPGFVCALSFGADGGLVDVAWEPDAGVARAASPQRSSARWHALRAVTAAASHWSPFRLDSVIAARIAQMVVKGEVIDPALAVYGAYAERAAGWGDAQLRRMNQGLSRVSGALWPDLSLQTAGAEPEQSAPAGKPPRVVPPVPLRAAGWASMPSLAVALPAALSTLARHVTDSPWAVFDPAGTALVRSFITEGGMQCAII